MREPRSSFTNCSRSTPLLVGISLPFQLRAPEFLDVARRLRAAGSTAHITLGGHFATFEYANILKEYPEVDSIVRHEGESALRELCVRLHSGESVAGLAGTLVRTPEGIVDGGKRRIPPLDELPFPDRRGEAHRVMGIPVSPLLGSRECYADCSFCCIYAYAENADGARYRRRSPRRCARSTSGAACASSSSTTTTSSSRRASRTSRATGASRSCSTPPEVSGGTLLDPADARRVRWTLPAEPGLYQAELALDFGADGVAFDVLMLEVSIDAE